MKIFAIILTLYTLINCHTGLSSDANGFLHKRFFCDTEQCKHPTDAGSFAHSCIGNVEYSSDKEGSDFEKLAHTYPLIYVYDALIPDNTLSLPLKQFARRIYLSRAISDSIDGSFKLYENLSAKLGPAQKDSMFFMFFAFMESVQPKANTDWTESDDYETIKEKLNLKYKKYGFHVFFGEGYPYLVPDISKVASRFDLTPDLKRYVEMRSIPSEQLFDDAALLIPWSQYAHYVLEIEELTYANQDNKYFDYFLFRYWKFLDFLLFGADNSRIVEAGYHEAVHLNPEIEEVYTKLISDKQHITGRIIEKHLGNLKKNHFEFTWHPAIDEIKAYFRSNEEGKPGGP